MGRRDCAISLASVSVRLCRSMRSIGFRRSCQHFKQSCQHWSRFDDGGAGGEIGPHAMTFGGTDISGLDEEYGSKQKASLMIVRRKDIERQSIILRIVGRGKSDYSKGCCGCHNIKT